MKTTKEMIAVMQAYEDGETIQRQVSGGGIWTTVSSDSTVWDWRYFDYRVKPAEPKKVMMQMFRYGDSLNLRAVSASLSDHYNYDHSSWEKVGEPFEFVFPEEVK